MKQTTDICCGLDLQRDYIGIAIYSARERAASQVNIRPIVAGTSRDNWESWETELKAIKSPLKRYASSVICSIPAEYAVVKRCMLDADEPKVAEALEWELSQQIMGSIDEYMFDYQETGAALEGPVRTFLVAAYRREFVDRIAGIIRRIKLEPRIIDLDIFGLINIFEANYPEKMQGISLLVHSEQHLTKLVVTKDGGFLDFHCFDHGTGFADPAGYGVALAAEIGRFVATQQAPFDPKGNTFATGSYLKNAENRTAVFEALQGVELLNPFRSITCQLEGIQDDQLLDHSTQLAVAVGLSLRSQGQRVRQPTGPAFV